MNHTEIKVNMETGKTTTVKGGVTYTGMVGFIASQRDMLCGYRDDGRVPGQDLLDDIKAYEYIISGGEDRVTEYREWRYGGEKETRKFWSVRPRDFLKHKGIK